MDSLYDRNGLIFWTEREIAIRKMMETHFVKAMDEVLRDQNRAFYMMQVEAPILTPVNFINPNYTAEDYYKVDDLVLRPETTMGSYQFADYLLNHQKSKLPLCIWQHGKSFRREQDQVTKNMRLKEFYQLEFQCIYGLTTANDYSKAVTVAVKDMIEQMIGPCKVQSSDRIPSYAAWTMDVICRDMEVCSISQRNDFPNAKVLEVAIGTDRCVYNFLNK